MINELTAIQAKYGDKLDILNEIETLTIDEAIKKYPTMADYYEENRNEKVVYTIDGVEGFVLSDVLIRWYTDYEFRSGIFETVDSENIYLLQLLNNVMHDLDDLDWPFEKAEKIIKEYK